jgi:hypothetical protein
MKFKTFSVLFLMGFIQNAWAQTNETARLVNEDSPVTVVSELTFSVQGATPQQEATLRFQITAMRPDVLPLRVIFVPHWKYVANTRIFQLHVPTGYTSALFTHLASRTTFIDIDRCQGDDWLGYWMAHELGHLSTRSAKEPDAERAARNYRKRLKQSPAATTRSLT